MAKDIDLPNVLVVVIDDRIAGSGRGRSSVDMGFVVTGKYVSAGEVVVIMAEDFMLSVEAKNEVARAPASLRSAVVIGEGVIEAAGKIAVVLSSDVVVSSMNGGPAGTDVVLKPEIKDVTAKVSILSKSIVVARNELEMV